MHEPLDSRQLRAFGVLARTGSFTQTARELHLTQSAISHAMKALERDGFVTRTVFPTIPPRVDYELTQLGCDLLVPVAHGWCVETEID